MVTWGMWAMQDKVAVSDHVLGIGPNVHPLIPEGGFFITQMGSDIGGSPGGVSVYDLDMKIVDQFPKVSYSPPEAPASVQLFAR